jgi:hypothetical protein
MKTATMFANGIKYNIKTEKAHSMAFELGGRRSWEAENLINLFSFLRIFQSLLFYDK